MADDVLRIERRERIAILTLNRPDRLNALSVELRAALTRTCQELRDDDNVWAWSSPVLDVASALASICAHRVLTVSHRPADKSA